MLSLTIDNPFGGPCYCEHSVEWLRSEIDAMGGRLSPFARNEDIARQWCELRGYHLIRVE